MEILDRIITISDYQPPGQETIPVGTIGTVRRIINNSALVQIGYEDEKLRIVMIPKKQLRLVTIEDLDGITSCTNILNPLFHPGNKYMTVDDKIFTIRGVKLAANEWGDLFQIQDENGIQEELVTRKFIDNASHIPYVEDETEEPSDNIIPEIVDTILDDEIKIIINKFEFKIKDNIINFKPITKDELGSYVEVLIKLNKLLKGE
jgi:hypothetical protein